MKKVLKYLLYVVGAVVVLIGAAALFIQIKGIPTYEAMNPDIKVEVTPERVANGKKIATMLCAECHMNKDTRLLTGKLVKDLPPAFGEIHSRNITKHPTKGIGGWSDGQLAYLLRTGIGRDGKFYPPYMPKFVHMSDEDLYSIIAFLRSDDPMVAASDVDNVESQPSFLTKFLCRVAFKPVMFPKEKVVAPPRTDKVAYGKYIVTGKVECYPCHSRDFKTMNIETPEKSEGYLGGGNTLIDMDGKKILSANITMDKETGIGNWTEEEFIKAVKYGQSPHGQLRYPMVPLTLLDDDEVAAVYAYLKTVPPLKNNVNRTVQ